MKSDNLLRHIAIPFGIAVIVYIIFYSFIEHRRTRNGPWRVTFTNDPSGAPPFLINQTPPSLSDIQNTFSEQRRRPAAIARVLADNPRARSRRESPPPQTAGLRDTSRRTRNPSCAKLCTAPGEP